MLNGDKINVDGYFKLSFSVEPWCSLERPEETSKYLPRRLEKSWFFINPDGYYELISDKTIYGSSVSAHPDWPAFYVNLHCAKCYSDWLSVQKKLDWEVPNELKWEKSVRGVDGRNYPWGNEFDGSYACTLEYFQEHEEPKEAFSSVVQVFPFDCSVYGVCGMSGNIHEWTLSGRRTDWDMPPDEMVMVYRGGQSGSIDRCHVSARGNLGNVSFSNQIGFRFRRQL